MSNHAYRFFLSSDETRGLLCELRDRFELVIGADRFASPWHPDIPFRLIDPATELDLYDFTFIYLIHDDAYDPDSMSVHKACNICLQLSAFKERPGNAYIGRLTVDTTIMELGKETIEVPERKRLFDRVRRYLRKKAHHPMYFVDHEEKTVRLFPAKATDDTVRVAESGGDIEPNDSGTMWLGYPKPTPLLPDWWSGPPLKLRG